MGKLAAAFVFFLAASALAIRESKPTPLPVADEATTAVAPVHVDEAAPSRAIRDEVPPWVKYATPTVTAPVRPTPPRPVITIEASDITILDGESNGDIPDVSDRCPDQPNDSDDNDGCPESTIREDVRLVY